MPSFISCCISLLLTIGLVCGCETQTPIESSPEITFSHLQAIKIDVATIEVENRFQAPLTAPHIEHLLPTPPSKAMEQWLRDRFTPVGRSGTLRMVIDDASATATPLDLDKSLTGQLTKQQSQLNEMNVHATLQLKDANGNILGTAAAKAERSITTREDISLNDRRNLWLESVSQLMNDFNRSMEPNIQLYLKPWLK